MSRLVSMTEMLQKAKEGYGRQQWGILDNGGNPDPAILCARRRFSDCKVLSAGFLNNGGQKNERFKRYLFSITYSF